MDHKNEDFVNPETMLFLQDMMQRDLQGLQNEATEELFEPEIYFTKKTMVHRFRSIEVAEKFAKKALQLPRNPTQPVPEAEQYHPSDYSFVEFDVLSDGSVDVHVNMEKSLLEFFSSIGDNDISQSTNSTSSLNNLNLVFQEPVSSSSTVNNNILVVTEGSTENVQAVGNEVIENVSQIINNNEEIQELGNVIVQNVNENVQTVVGLNQHGEVIATRVNFWSHMCEIVRMTYDFIVGRPTASLLFLGLLGAGGYFLFFRNRRSGFSLFGGAVRKAVRKPES